jgi:hypothetical protein
LNPGKQLLPLFKASLLFGEAAEEGPMSGWNPSFRAKKAKIAASGVGRRGMGAKRLQGEKRAGARKMDIFRAPCSIIFGAEPPDFQLAMEMMKN